MLPGGGAADTFTDWDAVLDAAPSLSVTTRVTVKVPSPEYVWLGFVAVEVAPSPKSQLRLAMVPSASVLVSVNEQARFVQLFVKFATGAWLGGGDPPPRESRAFFARIRPKP